VDTALSCHGKIESSVGVDIEFSKPFFPRDWTTMVAMTFSCMDLAGLSNQSMWGGVIPTIPEELSSGTSYQPARDGSVGINFEEQNASFREWRGDNRIGSLIRSTR
jgi:hypothetical protein